MLRRRLTGIFAAVALGASLSLASAAQAEAEAPPQQDKVQNIETAQPERGALSSQNPLWHRILKENSMPYDDNGPAPDRDVRPGSTIAIQLEEALGKDFEALLLLQNPDKSQPMTPLIRHGASAAMILQGAAGGDNTDVRYIERPDSIGYWIYDITNPVTQALFFNADVINLSMGVQAEGDQAKAFSAPVSEIVTSDQVRLADEFWRKSRAIFVISAGNNGYDTDSDLIRANNAHTIRADTYLPVGEARQARNGEAIVVGHSSRHSEIALVAYNPYFRGFSYRFFKNADDLRSEFNKFYDTRPPGSELTARQIFAQAVEILPEQTLRNRLRVPHPNFGAANFPGKDVLEKDIEWLRAHPDEVLEAYINALVDGHAMASAGMSRQRGAPGGVVSGLDGTSFASPNAAGMITQMHAKYPQLSEYDLTAAALIAAEPVYKVARDRQGRNIGALRYTDNGRGLPYNSNTAGFGILEKDAFERVVAEMAAMQEQSRKPTREVEVSSGLVKFNTDLRAVAEDPSYTDYKIEISDADDIVALSTHLELQFKAGQEDIPLKLTLISPSGGRINVSPTKLQPDLLDPDKHNFSLARAIGHFGVHTAGEWTIRVHHGFHEVELASARLTVKGMEKGGVVDKYLEKYGADLPPLPEPPQVQAAEEPPSTQPVAGETAADPQPAKEEQEEVAEPVTPDAKEEREESGNEAKEEEIAVPNGFSFRIPARNTAYPGLDLG